MNIQRKSIFELILLLMFLSILFSCSDDNPTSPTNDEVQNGDVIEINNISFSVNIEELIPTAFLNNFAKLCDLNECGLAEVKIKNNNNSSIQLKCSFKIENYTEEIYKTLSVPAKDSLTIYFTPVLSKEILDKINEIITVKCLVSVFLIDEEKEIFSQSYTRQMLAKDVMMWGDDFEFLPFIVTWVTPHVFEIEQLISKAKEYHPENKFIGYQGSESKDGYAKRNIPLFNNEEITVPPLEKNTLFVGYIDTNIMKNFHISVDFIAHGGTGDDIIVSLESGEGDILYNSGRIKEDSFLAQINKTGYYYLIFDNSFSWLSTKTVLCNVAISYDEDLIIPQVKAIYNALKNDYNIDYVSSPTSFPGQGTQRIRLPGEALTLGSANCIDGTVLFASALENIALEPIIIITSTHAFVGWKRWFGSNVAEFLETTMIGESTFEEAYNEGNRKYFDIKYEYSYPKTIDVKEWRDFGLTPLMKYLVIK